MFDQALFYFALAFAFLFAFSYRVVKICKIKKKGLKAVLFCLCCLLFALAALLIVIDSITSSFYTETTDLPASADIITADDVFNNFEQNEFEINTMQVRSWTPFLNTEVTEVQQSISYNSNANAYFYSIKLNSSKWFLLGFKEEILKYLHKGNTLSFDQYNETVAAGSFKKDNYDYRFIVNCERNSLVCIIYRGDFLFKQKLIYPLFD